ncbi:MAG: hypothetical protein IK048_03310 [Clostridia bacterium]|nr:hypothetical protein [Clostridia bacterium]
MKFFEIATLRSYYGALLTKKQNDMLKMHYDEDLSLAEIAEIYDVSRQAVADSLAKGEKSLREYDAKLGLIAKDASILQALKSLETEGQSQEVLEAIAQIKRVLED